MKNRALIETYGYFGDILFATSVAERLIEENQFQWVDMLIGFPQMQGFCSRNPWVSHVFTSEVAGPAPIVSKYSVKYDSIFKLAPVSLEIPPTIEHQVRCGVKHTQPSYVTYTRPLSEYYVKHFVSVVNEERAKGRTIVGYMKNWKEKSFAFTKEQYWRGINIPYLGYGGKLHDIDTIIHKLQAQNPELLLIEIGSGKKQHEVSDESTEILENMVSLMTYFDYFIGPEGGLMNFAAGQGVKCIMDTSFVWQLYGPNGLMKKLEDPKLGPRAFFDKKPHVHLDPFLTDEQMYDALRMHLTMDIK